MNKRFGGSLLTMALFLSACNGGGDTGPTSLVTAAPPATTAAVVEPTTTPTAVTETEELTATEELTDDTALTETETSTDSAALTTTEEMTDSTTLTATDDVTGASALTSTLDMTDTQATTDTAGIQEAPGQLALASDLQGYAVLNPDGEDLGSVQDLVFNLDDGQIVLVTVEYGGFLDIGDKVFPIPLSAFRFNQDVAQMPAVATAMPGGVITETTVVTDTGEEVINESLAVASSLILDIPEETFENAPGFADNFPVLTESATVGEIESFYRDLGEDVIGRSITETDLEALAGRAVKLSEIIGGDVQNPAGEGVGEIENMLVNLQAGKVEYLILSFGGFLGIGENQYAIPVDTFEVIPSSADVEAGAPELVLDITEEQLEGAPVFDELNVNEQTWDSDVRDFWSTR